MKLKEFLEKFIIRNTLVRLWIESINNGHRIIYRIDESKPGNIDEVCEEWKLLDGKDWRSIYLDREVIGIKDILCVDSCYKEAVNIVIKSSGDKEKRGLDELCRHQTL